MADLATLYPRLTRYARRYADPTEAEDIVQDMFLRLLPDRLDRAEGYFFATLRSVATDHYRRRRARPAVPLTPTTPVPERDGDAHEALVATLARLASIRHGRLLLAFAVGATLRELADAEGVGLATIKTRIHRARRALGSCPLDC